MGRVRDLAEFALRTPRSEMGARLADADHLEPMRAVAHAQFDQATAASGEVGRYQSSVFDPPAGQPASDAEDAFRSALALGQLLDDHRQWKRAGRNLIVFDPTVVAELAGCDAADDVDADILDRLPFDAFLMVWNTTVTGDDQLAVAWASRTENINETVFPATGENLAVYRNTTDAQPAFFTCDVICAPPDFDFVDPSRSARVNELELFFARNTVVSDHATIGRSTGPNPELAEPLADEARALLLYLAADNVDISSYTPRSKRKRRDASPDDPAITTAGFTVGAQLRSARDPLRQGSPTAAAATVRPHMRRAHWHTYWTGEGRTERRLRWLAPVPVNLSGSQDPEPNVRRA